MALDSAAKRQAVPGVGRPWMRGQFPSAAKDREWRSSTGLSYPVADFQGAAPPVDEKHRGFKKFRATRFGGRRMS